MPLVSALRPPVPAIMRGMQIEPARADDYDRLAAIWEAAVRATHHFLTEADIQLFRPLVRDGYLPGAAWLRVARDEAGGALGFVGVEADKVEMLFVDPACHGRGVGRALLQQAIAECGARCVDVNEQNPGAVAFYRRMGFVQAGRSERDGLGKPFPLLHLRLA
jgi:putative acetyltransferase